MGLPLIELLTSPAPQPLHVLAHPAGDGRQIAGARQRASLPGMHHLPRPGLVIGADGPRHRRQRGPAGAAVRGDAPRQRPRIGGKSTPGNEHAGSACRGGGGGRCLGLPRRLFLGQAPPDRRQTDQPIGHGPGWDAHPLDPDAQRRRGAPGHDHHPKPWGAVVAGAVDGRGRLLAGTSGAPALAAASTAAARRSERS